MAHDVFISHSTTDKTAADAVCAALENAGIRCWIAPRDVQPGRSFAGELTRAIQESKAMVLIFSVHSNNSEQVLREVQLAVNSHLHIIQFRIENVQLNDDLKYFLSTPHWLDALSPPLEKHLARLESSIKALLNIPPKEPSTGIVTPILRSQQPSPEGHVSQEVPAKRLKKKPFVVAIAAMLCLGAGAAWYFKVGAPGEKASTKQSRAINSTTARAPTSVETHATEAPVDKGQQLANDLWRASGGENWDKIKEIDFTFAVEQEGKRLFSARHAWNVVAGTDTVKWKDKQGKDHDMTVNLADPAQEEEAKYAFARWVNDSYWLLAPLKIHDPGVKVADGGPKDLNGTSLATIQLSFDKVGLTPTDRYVFYIDARTKLPRAWDYIPATGAGLQATWEKFQNFGGLNLATEHNFSGKTIKLADIKVSATQ